MLGGDEIDYLIWWASFWCWSRSMVGRSITGGIVAFLLMVIYVPPHVPYRWELKLMVAQVSLPTYHTIPLQDGRGGDLTDQVVVIYALVSVSSLYGQGFSFRQWMGYLWDNRFSVDMVSGVLYGKTGARSPLPPC